MNQRHFWRAFACLAALAAIGGWGARRAARGAAAEPPFGYGFLGGDFHPAEDAAISTWNDVHFGCHFSDAQSLSALQEGLDAIGANKVLIDLGRASSQRPPDCKIAGPCGDLELFKSRVDPLLPVLAASKDRLLALWIFDEPDVSHGGPSAGQLSAAVDYLHEALPGVPVFVNWFRASNNRDPST